MKSTVSMELVLKKLQSLPPERLMEVDDFIDFISERASERGFTAIALAASEPSLTGIWDNVEDAAYDEL
jgi:hypothetical protein